MSKPIEVEEYKGYTIKIFADEDVADPRKEWDNAGKMCCWHRRYNLGDEQPKCNPSEYLEQLAEAYGNIHEALDVESAFDPEIDAAKVAKLLKENYVILPLFLMDHSGISISTGSFNDPWDSGQVGYIYISMERARAEWGGKDIADDMVRSQAERCLRQEVETYDQYLRGDVWGYVIENESGEETDSRWGMYGHDYCLAEARSAGDYQVARAVELIEYVHNGKAVTAI